jgi:hypothetical protein
VAVCDVPDEDDGKKIVFVSYKYNARKVLHFVMTDGAGSTVLDTNRAYIAHFPNEYGNLVIRKVPRPACLSDYLENAMWSMCTIRCAKASSGWKKSG